MHDVAERVEVGVLTFERVTGPVEDEISSDVPTAFSAEINPSKLIILESGTSAESGIVLQASNGDEIVIVPSAGPYSLAVRGVLSAPHIFEPEYPLEQYARVPME